jgi:hypothetical protein
VDLTAVDQASSFEDGESIGESIRVVTLDRSKHLEQFSRLLLVHRHLGALGRAVPEAADEIGDTERVFVEATLERVEHGCRVTLVEDDRRHLGRYEAEPKLHVIAFARRVTRNTR